MPNILKTKGIVLHTHPFKESSLFCSIFSKDLGKLHLLAKGARRPKSKLCGTLEPFNHSEIIFYKREFKDTYTISDAVIIEEFARLRSSALKIACCETICEFIDKTQTMEESNSQIYTLTLSFLNKLCSAEENVVGLWTLILLFRLLKFVGFEPHLTDCVLCHKKVIGDPILNFSIEKGGVVCETHFDGSVIKMKSEVISHIFFTPEKPFPDKADINTYRLLKNLFETYIYYHLHGLNLRAIKFIF